MKHVALSPPHFFVGSARSCITNATHPTRRCNACKRYICCLLASMFASFHYCSNKYEKRCFNFSLSKFGEGGPGGSNVSESGIQKKMFQLFQNSETSETSETKTPESETSELTQISRKSGQIRRVRRTMCLGPAAVLKTHSQSLKHEVIEKTCAGR